MIKKYKLSNSSKNKGYDSRSICKANLTREWKAFNKELDFSAFTELVDEKEMTYEEWESRIEDSSKENSDNATSDFSSMKKAELVEYCINELNEKDEEISSLTKKELVSLIESKERED